MSYAARAAEASQSPYARRVSDLEVSVGGRTVMVRDAGALGGVPVVHFHGTPGSRREVEFGAEAARRLGVRVISFDRPGFGGSDAAPTTLSLVAQEVEAVAVRLGLERFSVLGWSGGGPFALATAALLGDRVTRVGISGGLAPVDQMPGAREALDENDLRALAYLPGDPARAAEQFYAGSAPLLDGMMTMLDDEQAPWIDWMWSESDPEVIADPEARRALFTSFREALRQGPMAIAWDNVAFVGPWGVDLDAVVCPVHLWYGDQDQMALPANGEWLAARLADAELVVYEGEGHLLPLRHWEDMLRTLSRERV